MTKCTERLIAKKLKVITLQEAISLKIILHFGCNNISYADCNNKKKCVDHFFKPICYNL